MMNDMIDPKWVWGLRTVVMVGLMVTTWFNVIPVKVPVVVMLGMLAVLFGGELLDEFKGE